MAEKSVNSSINSSINSPVNNSVSSEVVDFISAVKYEDFPAEAITLAKRCIIDGLGVMLAGSTQPAGRILREHVIGTDNRADATVFGPEGFKTSVAAAALVNGTSGHALDWDDTQLATSADRIFGLLTHPTIPPLVTALAIGEREGISGTQFLTAFLTGFEVECKISEAIHPDHYKKGFHSSATVGTFGAAVTAAKLFDLNDEQTAHMLAIAASSASGIRVSFGSMTKPLHVGRAAQNGIVATELAALGFTGGKDALDPPWGFFQTFSHGQGFDAERIVGKLGNPHTIVSPGVSIKPYPCGVLGHPTMDAMRRLVIDNDVDANDIVAIRVRAGSNILNPLRYPIANNELEAKFCPAFMMSAIALRRKAGIHEFNDEFVCSEPVQALMRKVECVLDPDIEAQGWEKIRSTVEVDMADGRTLVQKADERYRGGPDLPFSRDDLFEKFSDCASLVLSDEEINKVFALVESLETCTDIKELVESLKPVTSGLEA
ncbi:MAG: 2-methylcitrate dehydratase [SAR86 cluster bacterium]|uniref:2-methylcitrate dehydratase n=1 Tax=SAR86 cluster bacterium TaxID=2030880 RepID=A0A2A5C992_9GAMM|nr:MAG: 2-methylcitrate dehydratase [SAR86 cluster bacterium]